MVETKNSNSKKVFSPFPLFSVLSRKQFLRTKWMQVLREAWETCYGTSPNLRLHHKTRKSPTVFGRSNPD